VVANVTAGGGVRGGSALVHAATSLGRPRRRRPGWSAWSAGAAPGGAAPGTGQPTIERCPLATMRLRWGRLLACVRAPVAFGAAAADLNGSAVAEKYQTA
jgi:hypothetical protein